MADSSKQNSEMQEFPPDPDGPSGTGASHNRPHEHGPAQLQEKIDELNRTIQELQRIRNVEVGRFAHVRSELESAVTDARSRAEQLRKALQERDSQLEEAESWRRELQQWYDQLRMAVDHVEHEKAATQEQLAEAQEEIQAQQGQHEEVLADRDRKIEELSRQKDELLQAISALENERDRLQTDSPSDHNQSSEQLHRIHQDLEQREQQIEQLKNKVNTLQNQVERKHLHAGGALQDSMSRGLLYPHNENKRGSGMQRKNWLWGIGAAAALLVAVWFYNVQKPAYRVTGTIVLPKDNPAIAEVASKVIDEYPAINSELDTARGTLLLSLVTRQQKTGIKKLNTLGYEATDKIAAAVQERNESETKPSHRDRLAGILEHMDEVFARLEKSEQNTSKQNRRQLIKAWETAREQRQQVMAKLEEAKSVSVGSLPDKKTIALNPDELTRAEENDSTLRAAIKKSNELREQLARRLVNMLQSQGRHFESLRKTLREAQHELKQLSSGASDKGTRENLQAIRSQLTDCSKQAEKMVKLWDKYRETLSPASLPVTISACLNELGPPAKVFIRKSKKALDKADQIRTNLLEQSDSQPTKLVVLNKSITRLLKRVREARDNAATAAENFWLARNVPLATLAGELSQAKQDVVEQRNRIEEEMREKTYAALQKDHNRQKLSREESIRSLQQRAEKLNKRITRLAESALAQFDQTHTEKDLTLAQLLDWHSRSREKFEDFLAADKQSAAKERKAAEAMAITRYLPPVAAVPVEPAGYRVGRAMLAGAVPFALCALAWLLITIRQVKNKDQETALASKWLLDDKAQDVGQEQEAALGQKSRDL